MGNGDGRASGKFRIFCLQEPFTAYTIIFDAAVDDGSAGAAGLTGGGSAIITLVRFAEPSNIDNNDFSKGTDVWALENAGSAPFVEHLEEVGPDGGEATRRARRHLAEALVNQDLCFRHSLLKDQHTHPVPL